MSDKPLDNVSNYITEAFIALLAIHPFDKITVHEIVRKAGVSRSTFYLHFEDKFDLLNKVTNHIVGELSTFYQGKVDSETIKIDAHHSLLLTTQGLCKHVRQYNHFYLYRLRETEFVSYISKLLKSWMYPNLGEDRSIFASYGTIGIIREWLEKQPSSSFETIALKLTNIALYLIPDLGRKPSEGKNDVNQTSIS